MEKCYQDILNLLNTKGVKQRDIELPYAEMIAHETLNKITRVDDSALINDRITAKWSKSGLKRIKKAAWKIIEL